MSMVQETLTFFTLSSTVTLPMRHASSLLPFSPLGDSYDAGAIPFDVLTRRHILTKTKAHSQLIVSLNEQEKLPPTFSQSCPSLISNGIERLMDAENDHIKSISAPYRVTDKVSKFLGLEDIAESSHNLARSTYRNSPRPEKEERKKEREAKENEKEREGSQDQESSKDRVKAVKEKDNELDKERTLGTRRRSGSVATPSRGAINHENTKNSPELARSRSHKRSAQFDASGVTIDVPAVSPISSSTPRPIAPSSPLPELKRSTSPHEGTRKSESKYGVDGFRKYLQQGTLQDLVAFLAEAPDPATARHVVLAHRQFVRSKDLISTLIKFMENADVTKTLHFSNIFKIWIRHDLRGLKEDEEAFPLFTNFLETLRASEAPVHDILQAVFDSQMKAVSALSKSTGSPQQTMRGSSRISFVYSDLTEVDAAELAQQFCLFDQKLLGRVPIDEFLETRWTRDQAPNLAALFDYVNKLSHALTYQIMSNRSDEAKLTVLAKNLMELQNYNSVLAVFLALRNGRVEKLIETNKRSLSQKVLKACREIVEVMSPLCNFGGYRAAFANLSGPYIPCCEVHLKDLLYMTENNPSLMDPEKKIFNLSKLDSMGKTISIFSSSLTTPYEFEEAPATQFLIGTIRHIDIDELELQIVASG